MQLSPSTILWTLLGICAIAFAAIAIPIRQRQFRTRAMQELAARFGLKFLDRELPPDCPRPPFVWMTKPRNVIFGEIDGEPVIALDTELPSGRYTYPSTIVGRRWLIAPATPTLHPKLASSIDSGQWRFTYLDYNFFTRPLVMTPDQIEDVWKLLETHPPAPIDQARIDFARAHSGTFIPPRKPLH